MKSTGSFCLKTSVKFLIPTSFKSVINSLGVSSSVFKINPTLGFVGPTGKKETILGCKPVFPAPAILI